MPRVLITADDFGLAPGVNEGIVHCFRNGIVRSASLLVDAPATGAALELAEKNPGLEVGIHLGVVEAYSLLRRPSSLSDRLSYFPDRVCLHRHWRPFVGRYLLGRIRLEELEEELRRQLDAFVKYRGEIPFANATQHLHLLPGIQEILLRLAVEYGIGAIRVPSPRREDSRGIYSVLMSVLGRRFRRLCSGGGGIALPDRFLGFAHSGHLTQTNLEQLLRPLAARPDATESVEIMCHPGFDCPELRRNLPWAYAQFGWEGELEALTSPETLRLCGDHSLSLIQFKDLAHDRKQNRGQGL